MAAGKLRQPRLQQYARLRFLSLRNFLIRLQNLKSAEELEEEDREAQSAKLQELIRRGTPRDLAAAQELMKSLAGANPEAKPDYRGQALTELNKLEQKVILLNEMLDNFDSGRNERFASGDAYDVSRPSSHGARIGANFWIIASSNNTYCGATKDSEMDLRCRDGRFGVSWYVLLARHPS